MKYLPLLIFLIFTLDCFGQEGNPAVPINGAYNNASGNEKATWAGYVSGLFQTNNGHLEIQGTPYGFYKMCRHDTLDYGFAKMGHGILYNTQLSIGVTPNSKIQYHIDEADYGFSYAVLNNKKVPANFYNSFTPTAAMSRILLQITRVHYLLWTRLENSIRDPSKQDSIDINHNFYNAFLSFETSNDTTKLNAITNARQIIMTYLGVNSLKEVHSGPNSIGALYNQFIREKLKLFLGTEAGKFNEDFTNPGHSQYIADSITGSKVWCVSQNMKRQFSTQATILGELADDTVSNLRNFNREFVKFAVSIDGKFNWFELTGEFDYSHYYSGLYKNEKTNQLAASLTSRIKINSSLTIPITFKYVPTPSKAQYFGFLDIQYSLK